MTHQLSNIARAFGQQNNNALFGATHVLTSKNHADWAKQAHLDWEIKSAPVHFKVGRTMHAYENRAVLYRSDTDDPLSVVSPRFKAVQPSTMLKFFHEASTEFGFQLELAGSMLGGRRIWALANTGKHEEITKGDLVGAYLLFVTACDGSLATVAALTTIRLYCLNQLTAALQRVADGRGAKGEKAAAIRITHSAAFDSKKVKAGLGLIDKSWDNEIKAMKALAKKKVTKEDAIKFFVNLVHGDEQVDVQKLNANSTTARLIETYHSGVGQQNIVGTAWGLVNAVTRYVDHEGKSNNPDTRIYNAWLNNGARLKQQAMHDAVALLK